MKPRQPWLVMEGLKKMRLEEMTSSEEKRMSDKCQGVADEEIGPRMSGF